MVDELSQTERETRATEGSPRGTWSSSGIRETAAPLTPHLAASTREADRRIFASELAVVIIDETLSLVEDGSAVLA